MQQSLAAHQQQQQQQHQQHQQQQHQQHQQHQQQQQEIVAAQQHSQQEQHFITVLPPAPPTQSHSPHLTSANNLSRNMTSAA